MVTVTTIYVSLAPAPEGSHARLTFCNAALPLSCCLVDGLDMNLSLEDHYWRITHNATKALQFTHKLISDRIWIESFELAAVTLQQQHHGCTREQRLACL